MSEYKLIENIMRLSQSENWSEAKMEWNLLHVYEATEPERCLCGHYPIIELCILKNKVNSNKVTVGNCCVKKFVGLPSHLIFNGIKRVTKDKGKALNEACIHYGYKHGWINDWEYEFCCNTKGKRNLTGRQLEKRKQINEKFIRNLKNKPN
ncbi:MULTISPECIES: hypothetical protein [unclassified Neisseria]|uniref:hypothetical protein n=1 Tax=unclassified Neisseria TaxID=2623750 RepID=UPI002665799C|nr:MULTISPECIES: hypothetical protein [unclassified Neisseria]MDO1509036.1 hypothetical protein [Neisseria sp. MVDL19-042950]